MQNKQVKAKKEAFHRKILGGRYPTTSQQHKDLLPMPIDTVELESSKLVKKGESSLPKDSLRRLHQRMLDLDAKNKGKKNNPKARKPKSKKPTKKRANGY